MKEEALFVFKNAVKAKPLVNYIDDEDYNMAIKKMKNISGNIITQQDLLGLLLWYLHNHDMWIIDLWPKYYSLKTIAMLNNPLDDLIVYEGAFRFYQDSKNTYLLFQSFMAFSYDKVLTLYRNLQTMFINIRIKAFVEGNSTGYSTSKIILFEIPHSYINRQSISRYLRKGGYIVTYDRYFDSLSIKKKKTIIENRHNLMLVLQ